MVSLVALGMGFMLHIYLMVPYVMKVSLLGFLED